MLTEVMWGWLL